MAPLAPNNTPRYRFHYTQIGVQHTHQLRTNASPGTAGGFMNAYWTFFGSTIFGLVLDFVDWAPEGSDIFNVVLTGYEGEAYGAGVGGVEDIPRAYTFIGRSPGGRRCRFVQFGAKNVGGNYRVSAGELAEIDAVIALLQGASTNVLAIDGLQPLWHSYANVKEYDHWVDEVRP